MRKRKGLGKLLLEPIIDDLKNIFSMFVLVLEENKPRLFYEIMGAKIIDTVEIDVLGKKLNEFVYGWEDIRVIF